LNASDQPASDRLDQVYTRLLHTYGHHLLKTCDDPFRELILTILSHRTTRQDELAAFNAMWKRYGSWQAIRDAPAAELIPLLEPSRYPERKAPYIQGVLKRIYAERGEPSIDFLADLPTADAMNWLLSLPGVGLKTASLVLLFCFHKDVLPVDTHVHRVSQRVGLIQPRTSAEAAHGILRDRLGNDPQVLYNFHRNLFKHGQQICIFTAPRCPRCPLTDICDYYAVHVGDTRSKPSPAD